MAAVEETYSGQPLGVGFGNGFCAGAGASSLIVIVIPHVPVVQLLCSLRNVLDSVSQFLPGLLDDSGNRLAGESFFVDADGMSGAFVNIRAILLRYYGKIVRIYAVTCNFFQDLANN